MRGLSPSWPVADAGAARPLSFVLGYAVLWLIYGVIAKSSQDLNADMAEMVVWTRELALGYPKHPPLPPGSCGRGSRSFPLADWAYLVLSVITVAAGIFLACRTFRRDGSRREARGRAVPARCVPFYNFLGLEMGPELDPDPALGARHVGDAARARHARMGLGGDGGRSRPRPHC